MIKLISKLTEKPVLACIFGWVLFPSMYLVAGVFVALGVSVEVSFTIASPAGILGFCCWVSGFIVSIKQTTLGQFSITVLWGLIFSLIPLAFLGFSFWVAANGWV